MNTQDIETTLLKLRLSGMAQTLQTRVMQAQAAQEPFLDTLASLLQDELDRRRNRLMARRFKLSGLDEKPSLADFDWRFNPKVPRGACFELHSLKFLSEGANALLVGKPGTGKSHVAKAVAYQATLQGYDVAYVEADGALARYALADAGERAKLLKNWVAADLLLLDDLFLARRIGEHAAELLQTLVHQRYKLRRSIVITSNRIVQDWGRYLGDATMTTTILDRLMHRCAMLEFEGKSYRLREASARLAIASDPAEFTRPAWSTLGGHEWSSLGWPSGQAGDADGQKQHDAYISRMNSTKPNHVTVRAGRPSDARATGREELERVGLEASMPAHRRTLGEVLATLPFSGTALQPSRAEPLPCDELPTLILPK